MLCTDTPSDDIPLYYLGVAMAITKGLSYALPGIADLGVCSRGVFGGCFGLPFVYLYYSSSCSIRYLCTLIRKQYNVTFGRSEAAKRDEQGYCSLIRYLKTSVSEWLDGP